MGKSDLFHNSSCRDISCSVKRCVYDSDLILHLINGLLVYYLSLYLSDVFIINLLSNYLIQTCCCCRSLICSLYCRQIFDCQNFFCNTFIMRRCKLCAIFPVYFVAIVFRRIMACCDIDTCYAAQLTYCKGQFRCWTKGFKLICLDTVCC